MDQAQVRRANLLKLYAQFVAEQQAADPASNISGLDKAFAAHLQVHNTYFSGMKTGSRQIGDKLARQIETLTGQQRGWLDEEHIEERTTDMKNFLELAEKAYLSAPDRRKSLIQSFKDAIKAART